MPQTKCMPPLNIFSGSTTGYKCGKPSPFFLYHPSYYTYGFFSVQASDLPAERL